MVTLVSDKLIENHFIESEFEEGMTNHNFLNIYEVSRTAFQMPLQCFHKSGVSFTHQMFSGYDRAIVEIFRAASPQVVIPYLLSKLPLVPSSGVGTVAAIAALAATLFRP